MLIQVKKYFFTILYYLFTSKNRPCKFSEE